jgi:hypothetical protein
MVGVVISGVKSTCSKSTKKSVSMQGLKTTCSFAFEKSEAPKAFEGHPVFFCLSANMYLAVFA